MARAPGEAPRLLLLTRQDVVELLSMSVALDAVREAAAEYSRGAAQVPLRTSIDTHQPDGEMLVMPGYLPSLAAVGVKIGWQPATQVLAYVVIALGAAMLDAIVPLPEAAWSP